MDLSREINYDGVSDPVKITEVEEFRQMLTTARLAAELNPNKPNTAVRKACARMSESFTGPRSRKICKIAVTQPMPMAYIESLIRKLESGTI
jgi:hypothetical protein